MTENMWPHSMQDVVNRMTRQSNHFFDKATLRFFSSRVGRTLYAGRVFTTSEQREGDARRWTVRIIEQNENGRYSIASVGWQACTTKAQAEIMAAKVGELVRRGLVPALLTYGQDVALAHALHLPDYGVTDGWSFTETGGFVRHVPSE